MSSSRRRGVKRLARALVLAPVLAVAVGISPGANATHSTDPNIDNICHGLQSFSTALEAVGGFEELAESLPLTDLSPGAQRALRLADVLRTKLREQVDPSTAGNCPTTLSNLQTKLNNLDGDGGSGSDPNDGSPLFSDTNFKFQVDGVTVQDVAGANRIDVHVPVHLERTITQPLAFDRGPVSLHGGGLTIPIKLDTTLDFSLDKSLLANADPADDDLAFYLSSPPTLQIRIGTQATPVTLSTTFNGRFGFVDVGATVNGTADLGIDVALKDPDGPTGDGHITQRDFATVALADLVDVDFIDGSDFSATIGLDTNLITGSPDATVAFAGDLSKEEGEVGGPTITTNFGQLGNFNNIGPAEIVAGVTQLAQTLVALQGVGDAKIPFLDKTVNEAFSAAQPLIEFVDSLTAGKVVCGTEPGTATTLPSGRTSNLPAGQRIYCRATTDLQVNGTTVSWVIPTGITNITTISGAADATTVGSATGSPTAFPVTDAVFEMQTAGNFDVELRFSEPAPSARPHKLTKSPETAKEVLQKLARAAGFASGEENLNYDQTTDALTFHLIKNDIEPEALDAGFDFGDQLKAVTNIGGLSATGGASASIDADDVDVDVTFGVILVNDVADITPSDPSAPSLGDRFFMKVNNADGEHEVSVADLTASANVALKGKIGFLEVNATGSDTAAAGGNAFELGKADGRDSDPTLTIDLNTPAGGIPLAGGANIGDAILLSQFLADPAGAIDANCNVGFDGGIDVSATVAGTQIASAGIGIAWDDVFGDDCTPDLDGLDITPSADFNDELLEFDVDPTNPQQLLSLLLDNIDRIAAALDEAGALDQEVPLLGVNVGQLINQLKALREKLNALRTGGLGAGTITCGTSETATGDPQGDASLVNPDADDLADVFCNAAVPTAASNVQWTVTGGRVLENATSADTVGTDPTDTAAFEVDADDGTFKVTLSYQGGGSTHTAEFPAPGVPETLQGLASELTDLLGLPQSAIQFELVDVEGSDKKDLVVRLAYGVCTPGYDPSDGGTNPCTGAYQLPKALEKTLNVSLGDTDLVSAQGGGVARLDFSGIAQLNFGIDMDGFSAASPLDSSFVLDSSKLEATVRAAATGLDLSASVGPITVGINDGEARFNLAASLSDSGADPDNEQPVGALTDLLDFDFGADPDVDCGEADHDGAGGDDPVALAGDACARLPLEVTTSGGTTSLGDVGFYVDDGDIGNPADWHFVVPDDLLTQLATALLDFNVIFDGLNFLLDQLEANLRASQNGVKIPLIGDDLTAGADLIEQFQTGILDPLQGLANTVDGLTVRQIHNCVESILNDALGPPSNAPDCAASPVTVPNLTGLDILGSGHVDVKIFCGSTTEECQYDTIPGECTDGDDEGDEAGDTAGECEPDDPPDPPSAITDFQIDLEIGDEASTSSPFDLGIPGLRLRSTEGEASASVDWSFSLVFGVSRDDGFYVDPSGGEELSLTAAIAPPCQLTGELAFLQVDVKDLGVQTGAAGCSDGSFDPSNVSLEASLDLTGGRIGTGTLQSGTGLGLDVDLEASSRLKLGLLTKLRNDQNAGFPSVSAVFDLNWTPIVSTSGSGFNSNPTIAFNNVRLQPGAFLTRFLNPIVREVQRVTKPLQPIADTLRARLPVVSDLAEMVGQDPVTLIGLMKAIGEPPNDLSLIEDLIALIDFINGINPDANVQPTPPSPGGDTGILMGSFTVSGPQVLNGPTTPDQAAPITESPASGVAAATATALGPAGAGQLNNTANTGGLRFPFLSNPGQAFGLLLGKDIDLACWEPGGLKATAGFGYTFGPFMVGPVPVVVQLGGSATVKGRFELCYDSSGLRKVLTEGSSGEHLFDGIYLNDNDANGVDVPEIQLIGTVTAGAGVSVGIFTAGIEGGITLTTNFNLHDGPTLDGKLRIDEIWVKLGNPICLFDISGQLEAFLNAFLEVNAVFFSKKFTFELVRITLLKFDLSTECDPPAPKLADFSGSTLLLNMGPRAAQRQIAPGATAERFKLRQLGPGKVQVEAFGLTQQFGPGLEFNGPAITSIKAVGGSDNDTITLEPGATGNGNAVTPVPFTIPSNIWGDGETSAEASAGDGNDTILGGDGVDNIRGGGGNDKINAGEGGDTVNAGGGNDGVEGGVGGDTVNGQGEDDVINGGPGTDVLNAGPGDDAVNGGPGMQPGTPGFDLPANDKFKDLGDTIVGGTGNDSLQGLDGADTIAGDESRSCNETNGELAGDAGGGHDLIEGGPGADNISGGTGRDVIRGKEGNDQLCGNGDADDVFGELDSDTIRGGPGNDDLLGGQGTPADTIRGGTDRDYILGDEGTVNRDQGGGQTSGTVTINETVGGNDDLQGGGGNDVMYGAFGADTMDGDVRGDASFSGDDVMFGGAGGDTMNGNPGSDTMEGEAGTDQMDGDGGNDNMRGGTEADNMNGDDRDDASASGRDTMLGDSGTDTMRGGPETDTMNGGIDTDTMYGEGGGDIMAGDAANDTMYGGADNDQMHGDNGDDYIEGNGNGASPFGLTLSGDFLYGDENVDRLIGGTSDETTADGSDTLVGGNNNDVLAGDNASITTAGVETLLQETTIGAGDTMYGDGNLDPNQSGQDRMFGERGADTMRGGPLFDYMEGNEGSDSMYGEGGEDDMVGGGDAADVADAGETLMSGGDAIDFMAGDNAQITRGSRLIVLLDLNSSNANAAGDDTMQGDAAADVMYGQGENDTMNGNAGDDYMEGNSGSDEMHGGDDLDDMAGGSGHDDGVDGAGNSPRLLDFVHDEGDDMFGDAGVDYMGGDNANITRPGGQRQIVLSNVYFSEETPDTDLSGGDTMHGGTANDLMYGQGAGDDMFGDEDDDYMEGNDGSDDMEGNADADKMVGGSGQDNGGEGGAIRQLRNALDVGDNMYGNSAADTDAASDGIDFMSGDNSFIVDSATDRDIELYDVPFNSLEELPNADVSGGDTMRGNGADDVMYGQSAGDDMQGNAGDDYMEGNGARDTMRGNDDEDDMLGGSGHDDGGGPFGTMRELRDVQDVGDDIEGNAGVDYIGGDNALMLRTGTTNDFNGPSAGREVELYDLQLAGGTAVSANVSGGDDIQGNEGDDVIFGQGNGGQSASQADPDDDVDNDRDVNENGEAPADITQYDCKDGTDNGDGGDGADAADPQCADGVDEDAAWAGDVIHGGVGHDYIEGNHAADWIFGEADEDDITGGGSANDGRVTDDSGLFVPGRSGSGLLDGHDVIEGGPEDDVMTGDNAAITRPTASPWQVIQASGSPFNLYKRVVTMSETPEPAGAFGNDYVRGNAGEDDLYGNQGNDYLEGNAGEDAFVGDLGQITNSINAGPAQVIETQAPFMKETINRPGTLRRDVVLYADQTGEGAEGDDVELGNEGNDKMHGGPGNDLMHGHGDINTATPNIEEPPGDWLFGGDGNDALWGGKGHDHLFGGHGNDFHDLAPRPYLSVNGEIVEGADPPAWFELALTENMQGQDYTYGGFDKDAHQASFGRPGPRPGDRLIDWVGNTNIFFTCPGAYGEGVISRMHSPSVQAFLEALSAHDGAKNSSDPASSGYRELALVPPGGESGNPVYPGSPGHFTCPPQNVTPLSVSVSSASVAAGDSVTITADVQNTADIAGAGEITVKFSANGREIGRTKIDGLDPLQSETTSLQWNTAGKNGEQAIEVTLDPDNTLEEADETDNVGTATLTIAGTDVGLAPADLKLSRATIVQGDKVTVTATVRNTSTVAANGVTVRFTDNDQQIGEKTIDSIPAGGSGTASVSWKTNKISGNRTVAATVDAANAIEELDEANNSASVAVNVKPNKVKNGTYELSATGTAPDSWTSSSATSNTYVADAEGEYFVTSRYGGYWLSDWIAVAPGATCTVGLDAWGGRATLSVKQYSETGKGVTTNSWVLPASPSPVEYTYPVTISTKATKVQIMIIGGVDGNPASFDTAQLWGAC